MSTTPLPEPDNTGTLDQFLAAIAHDLKEPLRTIRCCSELLARQRKDDRDDKANLLLKHIADSTTRMQALVEDAIAFAAVDESGPVQSLVDMGKALEFTLKNLETAVSEAGASITSEPLPVVRGNFGALARVFQNLIANAITYRAGEPPRIHIGCSVGPGWTFSVADNGIGIQPEYREYVFQPLKRLHAQEGYPGTGLGLAICERIVKSHGGRIWLESQPGVGSTFYFTLGAIEGRLAGTDPVQMVSNAPAAGAIREQNPRASRRWLKRSPRAGKRTANGETLCA